MAKKPNIEITTKEAQALLSATENLERNLEDYADGGEADSDLGVSSRAEARAALRALNKISAAVFAAGGRRP